MIAFKFQEFIAELNAAENIDELIRGNFFRRLNSLKERAQESFFAPLVAATTVESNIIIGNKYLELINQAREEMQMTDILDKFGALHEETISEATGKSYRLAQLLKEKSEKTTSVEATQPEPEPEIAEVETPQPVKPKPEKKITTENKSKLPGKWVSIFAVIGIIVCAALYFGLQPSDSIDNSNIPKAAKVNLENTFLNDYLKSASLSGTMLFCVAKPEWNTLSEDGKKDFLKKILIAGNERGFDKIHLINEQGETVAYADGNRLEVK